MLNISAYITWQIAAPSTEKVTCMSIMPVPFPFLRTTPSRLGSYFDSNRLSIYQMIPRNLYCCQDILPSRFHRQLESTSPLITLPSTYTGNPHLPTFHLFYPCLPDLYTHMDNPIYSVPLNSFLAILGSCVSGVTSTFLLCNMQIMFPFNCSRHSSWISKSCEQWGLHCQRFKFLLIGKALFVHPLSSQRVYYSSTIFQKV